MPRTYTCAMCCEEFEMGWSDEEAAAEAVLKGVDLDEPVVTVCDDCYKLTPWGRLDS